MTPLFPLSPSWVVVGVCFLPPGWQDKLDSVWRNSLCSELLLETLYAASCGGDCCMGLSQLGDGRILSRELGRRTGKSINRDSRMGYHGCVGHIGAMRTKVALWCCTRWVWLWGTMADEQNPWFWSIPVQMHPLLPPLDRVSNWRIEVTVLSVLWRKGLLPGVPIAGWLPGILLGWGASLFCRLGIGRESLLWHSPTLVDTGLRGLCSFEGTIPTPGEPSLSVF